MTQRDFFQRIFKPIFSDVEIRRKRGGDVLYVTIRATAECGPGATYRLTAPRMCEGSAPKSLTEAVANLQDPDTKWREGALGDQPKAGWGTKDPSRSGVCGLECVSEGDDRLCIHASKVEPIDQCPAPQ